MDVLDDELRERGVARREVLPARRLLPHHQAELVAGVEEVPGLGVMRAADHVAVELVLEQLRIAPLQALRRGHPGVGEQLVAVEAEDLEPLAVEVEAVDLERSPPESRS